MKGIIDRFEGDLAVVEIGRETKDFPRSIFPKTAKAGDVFEINGNKVTISKSDTEQRRKEIEQLMDDVWED